MKRIVVALALVAALGGCSIFKGRGDRGPKTAVLGERIPVLTAANDSAVEPSLADIPVTVPAAAVNESWTQPGGNQAKSMGNVALAPALNDVWSVSIPGGPNKQRLAAPPVIAGGKLFVVDGDGFVRAFDAKSGARLWQTQLDTNGRDKVVQFGGGASVDDGRVYATRQVVKAEQGMWQLSPESALQPGNPPEIGSQPDVRTLFSLPRRSMTASLDPSATVSQKAISRPSGENRGPAMSPRARTLPIGNSSWDSPPT